MKIKKNINFFKLLKIPIRTLRILKSLVLFIAN